MIRLLIALLFCLVNLNAFAENYFDKKLRISVPVPPGALVVKGNFLTPPSAEAEDALRQVFDENDADLKKLMEGTLFTIGYFSGPIENGADAHLDAKIVSVKKGSANQMAQFTNELIKREEKETRLMSFNFFEKSKEIFISNKKFLVSKGVLRIKQNGQVSFSMPIYYYVSEIKEGIVFYSLSGEEEKVAILEKAFLSSKFLK